MTQQEDRCTAVSATGIRCQIQQGHPGSHFAQTGTTAHVWTTREPPPAPVEPAQR